jgi:protein gp37
MLEPLHWKKPRRVFVNSMSDLFHETVPDEFIDRVLAVMALCSQHTFQVLTKRAERMCRYMAPMDRYFGDGGPACVMTEIVRAFEESTGRRFLYPHADKVAKPLSNVWLGVSCEDQQRADERIPWLLKTPAAVRFVSAEPLLETVELDLSGVHWVIVGGESGHRARPCNAAWIRDIILQCRSAGVACFVKQLGSEPRPSHAPSDVAVRFLKDKKGGDPAEWPADLRVREFPASPAPLRET